MLTENNMNFNYNTSPHDGILSAFLSERNMEILSHNLEQELIITLSLNAKIAKHVSFNTITNTINTTISTIADTLMLLNSPNIRFKELLCKLGDRNAIVKTTFETYYEHTNLEVHIYASCPNMADKILTAINNAVKPFIINIDTSTIMWYYLSRGKLDCVEIEDVMAETICDSFYPWIDQPIDDYINSYLQDKASVALFYGPPGTGKTTLIRHICSKARGSVYYTNDSKVMESGDFFMNFLTDTDSQILVLEDIDIHLTSRESGNSFMYQLLGTADGFIRNRKKKIIISSNIKDVSNVDTALLRDGRCWGQFRVGELSFTEANRVLNDLNKSHISLNPYNSYTLSKLFAMK